MNAMREYIAMMGIAAATMQDMTECKGRRYSSPGTKKLRAKKKDERKRRKQNRKRR